LRAYLNRLRRYVVHLLPLYFSAAVRDDPLFMMRPAFIRLVVGSLFRNYAFVPPEPVLEVRADLALVYGELYKEKVCLFHGYDPSQVRVVGAMDSDALVALSDSSSPSRDRSSWLSRRRLRPERRTLTYLVQPLAEDGLMDRKDYVALLRSVIEEAARNRLNLVVKAHPRSSHLLYDTVAEFPDVWIESTDLAASVHYSDVVLGHYSSALNLAVAERKAVLVWAPFGDVKFVRDITDRWSGVATYVSRGDNLGDALRNAIASPVDPGSTVYDAWLRRYYHFDGQEKVAKRVAEILIGEFPVDGVSMGPRKQ